MIIIRPSKEHIDLYVGLAPKREDVHTPSYKSSEWDKNHKAFVLRTLLPKIRPPKRTWRIVVEAYLTRIKMKNGEVKSFEEILCDGSSVVPDLAYKHGLIKDPWAMGHDLAFFLHRMELVDAYGKDWSFSEANDAYRDGWYAQKHPVIGFVWWLGLTLFGRIAWNSKFNGKPEKITEIAEE